MFNSHLTTIMEMLSVKNSIDPPLIHTSWGFEFVKGSAKYFSELFELHQRYETVEFLDLFDVLHF